MERINYKLEVFEGPMDLLLKLIAQKKIGVQDVPITEIIEQYLDYVCQMEEDDLELSSEFLEMAARLLYIKTVSLLPSREEAEKLVEELRGELTEYRDCKFVAEKLRERSGGFELYARRPGKIEADPTYSRVHRPEELLEAYSSALAGEKRRTPPPIAAFKSVFPKKIISVTSRISFIMEKFRNSRKQKMISFFENSRSRSEMVATFLAILAMIKAKRMRVDGDGDSAVATLTRGRREGDAN